MPSRLLFSAFLMTLTDTVAWYTMVQGADQRPNVLFIVADDLNCALGVYGDGVAVTPNLDRLAARGVVFERAYCQQAVCNPSRSSFLTGLRPDTVAVDDLRKSFRQTTAFVDDELVTLPEFFRLQGYFCRNIGKIFHNMGETQDRRSWSVDEVLYRGTHAADTVYANTPPDRRDPLVKKAPVTECLPVSDQAYRDGQTARLAATMLRTRAEDADPFFLAIGFWRPHLPFVAPQKYWDLYEPQQIPLPFPEEAPTGVPEIALHASREIRGYDGIPADRRLTEAEIRHLRHGYYASISFMDAQLGLILDALETGGHAEDTIIVFTSDHGFHIGEQTLWGKTSNFELDARVPLIIADPRRAETHGQATRGLVELVDLYPTLAHLTGTGDKLSERLEGVSVVRLLDDPGATIRDAAFTQHQQPFYGPRSNWKAWGRSMRTAEWRYTEWRAIADGSVMARELYDHRRDDAEQRNVAEQYPQVVGQLAALLAEQFPVVAASQEQDDGQR